MCPIPSFSLVLNYNLSNFLPGYSVLIGTESRWMLCPSCFTRGAVWGYGRTISLCPPKLYGWGSPDCPSVLCGSLFLSPYLFHWPSQRGTIWGDNGGLISLCPLKSVWKRYRFSTLHLKLTPVLTACTWQNTPHGGSPLMEDR